MQTTHAEDAVLSYVVTADPAKGIAYAMRFSGLPDFDCSPNETRVAIDSLRKRGVIRKNGPYYNLTADGLELMQPVLEQLASLGTP